MSDFFCSDKKNYQEFQKAYSKGPAITTDNRNVKSRTLKLPSVRTILSGKNSTFKKRSDQPAWC